MASKSTKEQFPLDAFKNILALEQERGYKDTAVLGGLDIFLRRWTAHISKESSDPLLTAKLIRKSYSSMTQDQRATVIKQWLTVFQTVDPKANQKSQINLVQRRQSKSVELPVNEVTGIDSRLTAKLERLGVVTVRDLLYLFPRRHNDYSNIVKIANLLL